MAFSTITTAPSTIMPKSSAPRLIRLALTLLVNMPVKVNSIASGITIAVISAARILQEQEQHRHHQQCTFEEVFFTVAMAFPPGWCGRKR